MVSGQPFNGKTVWVLKLAKYLAESGNKVLYISHEECNTDSLNEKIRTYEVTSPNITFSGDLPEHGIAPYDFIIMDSSSDMKLSLEDFKAMKAAYPEKSFLLILRSTKNGTFRGSQDWLHEMDIAIEIYKYEPIVLKNRYATQDSLMVTAIDKKQRDMQDRKFMNRLIEEKRLLQAETWLKKNPPPKEWAAGKYAWAIEKMPGE